jgi:hypothetical protein
LADLETIAADADEPSLKKHKGAILGIEILIKETEAEERVQRRQAFCCVREGGGLDLNDDFWRSWNRLRRRRACLADAQQFILDRGMETFENGLFRPSMWALTGLIEDNDEEIEKIDQEFYHGASHDRSKGLLDKYSSLKSRHKSLMETKDYISAMDSRQEDSKTTDVSGP